MSLKQTIWNPFLLTDQVNDNSSISILLMSYMARKKESERKSKNPLERCIIHAHADWDGVCICLKALLNSVLYYSMITVHPCLCVFKVKTASRLNLAQPRPESDMLGFCLCSLQVSIFSQVSCDFHALIVDVNCFTLFFFLSRTNICSINLNENYIQFINLLKLLGYSKYFYFGKVMAGTMRMGDWLYAQKCRNKI